MFGFNTSDIRMPLETTAFKLDHKALLQTKNALRLSVKTGKNTTNQTQSDQNPKWKKKKEKKICPSISICQLTMTEMHHETALSSPESLELPL